MSTLTPERCTAATAGVVRERRGRFFHYSFKYSSDVRSRYSSEIEPSESRIANVSGACSVAASQSPIVFWWAVWRERVFIKGICAVLVRPFRPRTRCEAQSRPGLQVRVSRHRRATRSLGDKRFVGERRLVASTARERSAERSPVVK